MVLPCDEHLGLLAAPLAVVASEGAEEECKRTVERNLQGTNVDNLFDTVTVAVAGDDFVALLVPCNVPVVVEWTKVLRFVH